MDPDVVLPDVWTVLTGVLPVAIGIFGGLAGKVLGGYFAFLLVRRGFRWARDYMDGGKSARRGELEEYVRKDAQRQARLEAGREKRREEKLDRDFDLSGPRY